MLFELTLIYTAVFYAGIFVAAFTFLSLVPLDYWWVRIADFPRLQVLILGLFCLSLLLFLPTDWNTARLALILVLTFALAYQAYMVLPFTVLWRKQVEWVTQKDPARSVSLLSANVLMTNTHFQKLIGQVKKHQPDVLLTLESNQAWQNALVAIEADYPHRVAEPLDNLYGMHLYSKLPLAKARVKYLLDDEIPSIHAHLSLASGEIIHLYCLHPKPPSPTEAADSTLRDAEILLVGKRIKEHGQPSIVVGDLNDVAWSRTTKLFQRISGLLDPRVGRGFYNTFHAKLPFLRWSLDHLFHSPCFKLNHIERLPSIGSDHFAVLVAVQLEAGAYYEQSERVEEKQGDDDRADDKIRLGLKKVARRRHKLRKKLAERPADA